MEITYEKQCEIFKEIKDQNNLLLGFIGLLFGIIFSTQSLSKAYLVPFMGLIFSFSISLYGFYLSTGSFSNNKIKNSNKILSLIWITRFGIGFLFLSVLTFSYIYIGGLI
mgnify:CR=1 FL=1